MEQQFMYEAGSYSGDAHDEGVVEHSTRAHVTSAQSKRRDEDISSAYAEGTTSWQEHYRNG